MFVVVVVAAVFVVVVAVLPPSSSDNAASKWTREVECTDRFSCSKALSCASRTRARGGQVSRQFASTFGLRPPCTPAAENCPLLRARLYASYQRKSAF